MHRRPRRRRARGDPGLGEVITGGIVAYANEVKVAELGVPAELIEQHGAVSAEVAEAMAQGRGNARRRRRRLDHGVAGPGGGTEDKPVGLVYFHAETPDAAGWLLQLPGDRDSIRRRRSSPPHLVRRLWTGSRQSRAEMAASVAGMSGFASSSQSGPTPAVEELAEWQAHASRRQNPASSAYHARLSRLAAGRLPAIDVSKGGSRRRTGTLRRHRPPGDALGRCSRSPTRQARRRGWRGACTTSSGGRLSARGVAVVAARDRSASASGHGCGEPPALGWVSSDAPLFFTSAPDRGAVRGARLISARG
jgi:nicotinamide-nucleotide amidase